MMRQSHVAGIVMMLVAAVALGQASQPVSVLLEKAIYTEETVGDVDAAIKLYQEVVDQHDANAKLAAEAQYRIGAALLKKDQKDEAVAAFRKVVAQYPTQPAAAKAKGKLSGLGLTAVDMGPMVIKTDPVTLKEDVDPALTEIRVTFDRRMSDGSWSWTGGGDTFPKPGTGKIHYDEAMTTCIMPVTLEPGKVYSIGINSPSHRNFKAANGQPAQRYAICFATRSADGKPTPIPQEMAEYTKLLNSSVGKPQPVVVKTVPQALKNDVSPKLNRLSVTFDQKMMNSGWSWTGGGDTFPKVSGKIAYQPDRLTCVMPVELEPGKVYWVGINSPSHQNFKTLANVPAKRYVICFATAGADGKPTPIPEEMLKQATAINEASGGPAATEPASEPAKE